MGWNLNCILRFAHICICGVRWNILFEGKNPFYISLFLSLATLYWILDCQITRKWRTVLWSDYNLHSFFSSKDKERKHKCFAGNWFPWLSGLRGCVTCNHYAALLFEILNWFGVCVCAGTRPLLSGADKNQAGMVYWFLEFEVTYQNYTEHTFMEYTTYIKHFLQRKKNNRNYVNV